MPAEEYRQMFRLPLIQTGKDLWNSGIRERLCSGIRDDAYNRGPRSRRWRQLQVLSDGILVWPVGPSHRLVDHRDLGRPVVVGVAKQAAFRQPHAHQMKI